MAWLQPCCATDVRAWPPFRSCAKICNGPRGAGVGQPRDMTDLADPTFIDRLQQARESTATAIRNKPEVVVTEYAIGTRSCVRFDLTDPGADGVVDDYRTVVYFDRETNLPVRYES